MTITLYQSPDDPRVVDKFAHRYQIATYTTASIKAPTNVVRPSIILSPMPGESWSDHPFDDVNQVSIAEFNRIYFVRNVTQISRDVWQLDLEVDVLFTYLNGYVSTRPDTLAYVTRSEYHYDPDEPVADFVEQSRTITFDVDPTSVEGVTFDLPDSVYSRSVYPYVVSTIRGVLKDA